MGNSGVKVTGARDSRAVLTIDAGTTSNRVIVFNQRGEVCFQEAREFRQIYPKPGWVEHDASEIWHSVSELLAAGYGAARAQGYTVAALSITNQRETVLLWNRDGQPLAHAIVWQDRRGAGICEELVGAGLEGYIYEHTGLVVDAYFSASKIAWLLRESPSIREQAAAGEVLCGTIDSWLIYKLTSGRVHATDYTNASRTMLYDIRALQWDTRLLEQLEIPGGILPSVHSSNHYFGTAEPKIFGVTEESSAGGGAGIPICGVAGDQQAALFGQACFKVGMAKNTYGTGSFALMNIGSEFRQSQHRLLTTIAWGIDDKITYALEGSIFVTGAAVQWLRDELQIIDSAADSEALAVSVPSSEGVYVVPAFVGLGAPHWDMYARGAIFGLTRGSKRAHIVRATLESLAYQSREVLDAMSADAGAQLSLLRVDGGATVNNFLMQFQADILNKAVSRPQVVESTARGSAFMAGLTVGVWGGLDEIAAIWQEDQLFQPSMGAEERDRLYGGWERAVGRTKGWENAP